jgi:hypothetical protein
MMQSAALIVGVSGAMIVLATPLVDVVVMGVTRDAGSCDIVHDVLLCRHNMLEMDADQWRDADDLGNQKQSQKPMAKSTPNVDHQSHNPEMVSVTRESLVAEKPQPGR